MRDFNGVYIKRELSDYSGLKTDTRDGYEWIVKPYGASNDTQLKLYTWDFNLAIF